MTRLEFPLDYNFNTSIGMDNLLQRMHQINTGDTVKYPPYNILKVDDYLFRIEVAVAGFSEEELEIEFADDVLLVTGRRKLPSSDDESQPQFLHKGISERSFDRKFVLSPDVIIGDVTLENGILKIMLEREIPEHKKSRKIEINRAKKVEGTSQLLTENDS